MQCDDLEQIVLKLKQAVADANRGKWNAKLAFLQGVVYANAEAY